MSNVTLTIEEGTETNTNTVYPPDHSFTRQIEDGPKDAAALHKADELSVYNFRLSHSRGCIVFTGRDGRVRQLFAGNDGVELFESLRLAVGQKEAEDRNREPRFIHASEV